MLKQHPFAGHLCVFRGRRGDLFNVLWLDGKGVCMFLQRLDRVHFFWPSAREGILAARLSDRCRLNTADAIGPRRGIFPDRENGRACFAVAILTA